MVSVADAIVEDVSPLKVAYASTLVVAATANGPEYWFFVAEVVGLLPSVV